MTHATTFDAFQHDNVHDDTHSKKSKRRDGGTKMSNNQIFDTLQYANKLKAVGVPEKQAEVQAEVMVELIEDKLATKKDLELVRKDLELVRAELKKDIKELDLKIELVKSELKHDIKAMGYKTIVALAIILPAIISILEYLTRLRG